MSQKKEGQEGEMGNLSDDNTSRGIAPPSGNFFQHYTGTLRISTAPLQDIKKLCPKCGAGERNYPHAYKYGTEERICPGVSVNPHGGKDGSGIQPKIRNLSERTAVQPDPVIRDPSLGKFLGGLALHMQQTNQSVNVHRIDAPSDPNRDADAYFAKARDKHRWGRPDRQWSGVGAVYISQEAFPDGIVPTMQAAKAPSLPHVVDRRTPKTGAVTEGSQTVSPPKPAAVSSDRVEKKTATSIHVVPETVGLPAQDRPSMPRTEPKERAPQVKPEDVTIVQNGDTPVRVRPQETGPQPETIVAPSSTVVRPHPSYFTSQKQLATAPVRLPVQQLLLTERGELLKPSLIYTPSFIREAFELSRIPEDQLATVLATLGVYRAMRYVTPHSPKVEEEQLAIAKLFSPSSAETAALVDLLATPVNQRRERAELILEHWKREADKKVDAREVADKIENARLFLKVTWDQAYVRSYMRGLEEFEERRPPTRPRRPQVENQQAEPPAGDPATATGTPRYLAPSAETPRLSRERILRDTEVSAPPGLNPDAKSGAPMLLSPSEITPRGPLELGEGSTRISAHHWSEEDLDEED